MPRQTPGKIIAVGRNWAEHASELGLAVASSPRIFFKPPSSVIATGEPIILPARDRSREVEHEAELAVVIGRTVRHLRPGQVLAAVSGYCCANDVTARDIQRADQLPDYAKSFDSFCPLGEIVPAGDIDPTRLSVECLVNGDLRQAGCTSEMLFPVTQLIAFITAAMTLDPGDVILTGTPSGTSRLKAGDVVTVRIPGVGELTNPVVAT